MFKFLSIIQKNLIGAIPASMLSGMLFGYFADPAFLKVTIIPLTFLMVYPMMVNLPFGKVMSGGDLKLQLVAQLINFALIPFVAFAIGRLFFAEEPLLALGLLLAALLPTSGMTISWTGFAKGNLNAAIKMTVIGLVAGSLVTPLYVKWLMGAVIEIPLLQVFRQIVLIVFLPMAAGYLTQRLLLRHYGQERYHREIKQRFPPLSTLGVLGIVFVAMALKAEAVVSQPQMLLVLLLPLLMSVFGEQGAEIALIIALAYIIQVQSAAWYVKFTDSIFGSAAADEE